MSSKQRLNDVETVEAMYAAFNAGEIDDVLAGMAPDVEWVEPEGDPYGGTHRGPEAVRERVFAPSMEDFEAFTVDVDRFLDAGEAVVVLGTFRGTAASTGPTIATPFAHVCEVEDGRLARFQNYTDTAVWQAALGT